MEFSKDHLARVKKILGTERVDPASYIEDIMYGVGKYRPVMKKTVMKTGKHKFVSKDNLIQARKDLEELQKVSSDFLRLLEKKFLTDNRPTAAECVLHSLSVLGQHTSQRWLELRGMDPVKAAQIAADFDSKDLWKIDLDGLAVQVFATNCAAFVASNSLPIPSDGGQPKNIHFRAFISLLKRIYESCTGKEATPHGPFCELAEICLRKAGHPIDIDNLPARIRTVFSENAAEALTIKKYLG